MTYTDHTLRKFLDFAIAIGPIQRDGWQSVVYGGQQATAPRKGSIIEPTVKVLRCTTCLRLEPCPDCERRIGNPQARDQDSIIAEPSLGPTGYEILTKALKASEAEQRRSDKRVQPLTDRTRANIAAASNTERPFACTNEAEVMFLFAEVARSIGYRIRRLQPNDYPDGLFFDKNDNLLRIEFEYIDSNFIAHAHNPDLVDLIVCWRRTKRGREELSVPVIALEDHYQKNGQRWDWSTL